MAWVDPRTWTALEKLTAAKLNEVRDSLKAIGDAWTSWAPTWGATGTAPVIGNGTITGRKLEAGKLTFANISIVMGSTTTFGTGTYTFTTPSTMQNFRALTGNCEILDTSASAVVPRTVFGINTTVIVAGDFTPTRIGPTTPITFANGDRIDIGIIYEAA